MKAKEYAQKIIHSTQLSVKESDETIYSVIMSLFSEMVDLVKSRRCACDSAFCAVFDEIDNKWIAVCNIVNNKYGQTILLKTGFREVSFKIADKRGMPELRTVWKPRKISN